MKLTHGMAVFLAMAGLLAAEVAMSDEPAPTLAQQLQQQREKSAKKIPADVRRVMKAKTEELARSGLVEKSLKVGDKAPDFELPNANGKTVRLSDLLQHGPVVVAFYRGGWCPYCNLELRALQKSLAEIENTGPSLSPFRRRRPILAFPQNRRTSFSSKSSATSTTPWPDSSALSSPCRKRSARSTRASDTILRLATVTTASSFRSRRPT